MHSTLMRIARQMVGSRATRRFAWARWAQLRAASILKFRGVLLAQRVEWDVPGHARTIPFEVPGPGLREVVVRVDASAVSPGTEKAHFAGAAADMGSFPRMPGYSAAGSIVSLGRGVTGLSRGQRVAVRAPHGSLAVVDQNRAFAIPDGVSIEDAAFIQLGIIALHGFGRAKFAGGERVVVLGRGPIGQLTVQLAKALGASYVVSVAPTSRHISLSLKGYADRVIASAEEEVDLGELEADVVFESSGATAALAAAITASRDGGRVVLLGSPRDTVPGVDLGECADRGIALIGAHIDSLSDIGAYRRAGTTFLELIARGLISPRDLVSVEVDPAEAGRFYRDLLSGDGEWVGALLRWDRLAGRVGQRAQFFQPPPHFNSSFLSQRSVRRPRSPVAPPRGATTQKPMRFAIIGSGSRGSFHARSLAAVGGAELGAVLDVSPRLAEQLGAQLAVPWTTDYAAILSDKNIDTVFICTPHHLHADQAMAAAAAGKHVIVEKPLAHTVEDAARIVRSARECEVALSVSLNYRYSADIITARALLAEGLLGEFTGAHISHHIMKAPHYAASGSGGPDHGWRGRWSTAGGGVLLMNGIHYLDLLLHLSGVQVDEVSAYYSVTQPGAEVEDSLTMWMRFANGATATMNVSSTVPGFYRNDQVFTDFRMWGREGQLALRPWRKYFSSRALRGRAAEQWHTLDPDPGLRDTSVEYLEDFVRAVQMGDQPPVGGDDGLRVQAVIESAYRSAREGRPVTVEIPQL